MLKDVIKYFKTKKSEGANIKFLKTSENLDGVDFNHGKFVQESQSAKVIEESDNKLKLKDVIKTETQSGFAYFLDGIERKKVIFNYNFIPVTYGYVSAVILKRTDKKMHSIGLELTEENLFLPYKQDEDAPDHYFNYNEFEEFKNIKSVNIGTKDKTTGEYPIFPEEFAQKAHNEIQETRRLIEQNLAENWLSNDFNDGWLFIDGRLSTKSKKLLTDARAVGVIKSHHVNYFSPEEQFKIYSLKKGQRSSVFQPEKESKKTGTIEKENVYSWYLRLHESKQNGENTFGLVRVEIPAQGKLLSRIDEISNWILLETKPAAFPASRWDRMIYPIKYCEDYLKSKAPTWALIESLY